MGWLVVAGAGFAVAGLVALAWSAAMVVRARRARLPDAELRARVGRALPVNLLGFLLTMVGLGCVGLGVALGG